jgi:DNA replication and repair protein RecF
MKLDNLSIKNYRNIRREVFIPSKTFNIIYGDNAQGKTNLLEIIYLIGNLKSFRGGGNSNFINKEEEECHLDALVHVQDVYHQIKLSLQPSGKQLLFDGKSVRNYTKYFSCLRPIVFAPEEISVTKGPPAMRRALLDRAIFQADPTYLQRVREYDLSLRQRNRALHCRFSSEEIKPWTESLIRNGARLRLERFNFLEEIIERYRSIYNIIANNKEEANITYSMGGNKIGDLEESLRRELHFSSNKEAQMRITMAGPHRDDLAFSINGCSIKNIASQGQHRSCILAFKTAQVLNIEEKTGEIPVLLLDDLNSELDRGRQDFYFDFLLPRSGQVFITTTDPQPFVARNLTNALFFRLVDGRIYPDKEMRNQ